MISARLHKRLRKDRPMVSVTLRMPEDVREVVNLALELV